MYGSHLNNLKIQPEHTSSWFMLSHDLKIDRKVEQNTVCKQSHSNFINVRRNIPPTILYKNIFRNKIIKIKIIFNHLSLGWYLIYCGLWPQLIYQITLRTSPGNKWLVNYFINFRWYIKSAYSIKKMSKKNCRWINLHFLL